MRTLVSLLTTLLVTATALAEEPLKRLTLEGVFVEGEPRLESLGGVQWLPDGEHLIYRTTDEEATTIWRELARTGDRVQVADWRAVMKSLGEQRPHFVRAQMGDVNSSSSQRTSPVLSPDGKLFTGGHAGDLYLFDLAAGTARFLTADAEQEIFPAFSPDGSRIGFVKDADIYWIDLATGVTHRVTDRGRDRFELNGMADWVHEEELDVERCFWWSPDGSRIAYLQFDVRPVGIVPITSDAMPYPELEEQWYPKAGTANARVRLGVVGVDGGETTWVDLGRHDHYLPRAGWTPQGELWVQRLNRDQDRLDLLVADPATGAVRTLLTETAEAWININDDLHFLDDGRFLWTSERDGWRHLYLYDADGSSFRQLTSGSWEVGQVYGTDAAGRMVFFQANRGDHRQRHIFSVELGGGSVVQFDAATRGSHTGYPSPDGSMVVDVWSSLETPPRADVLFADGSAPRRLWESGRELAEWDLLPVEPGSITADDGTELYSLLLRPRDFDPAKKYPVVLYVYGGPHSQLTADRWGGSVHNTYRLLADMGIATFMVDNRGTAGRGRSFETAVYRRLGELEVADQLAAARWLAAQPWVDSERIAVYGGSYGGYMTLLLMFRGADVFRAGIAYAPVTDWRLYDTIYTERYMDRPQDNPEGYEASAPLTWAKQLEGALLVAHGSMDNNVHLQNTLQLIDRLAGEDKAFELMVYPRTRHGVRRSSYSLHFHRLKTDFLVRHLLDRAQE